MVRIGMVGKKLRRILSFCFHLEFFKKLRHCPRVISRIVQNLRSTDIRLRLGSARITQQDAARGEGAELSEQSAAHSVAEQTACNAENSLCRLRLAGLICSVSQGHVRNL